MAEALAKKKRIRAGHKASATKTIRQIEDILASKAPDKERLSLLRLTLNEKLETIKALDSEVIELIEDDDILAGEIEQADDYIQPLYPGLCLFFNGACAKLRFQAGISGNLYVCLGLSTWCLAGNLEIFRLFRIFRNLVRFLAQWRTLA